MNKYSSKNFTTNNKQNEGTTNSNENNESQNENKDKDNSPPNEEEEKINDEQEEPAQTQYKTSRRLRFYLGKIFKYLFIGATVLTLYNVYLYKYESFPKEKFGYNYYCWQLIKKLVRFRYLALGSLTLPFDEKVLPDSIEPIGHPTRKILVLNLNKTLINYGYKFGSGFEILKRPGLLKFLKEMSQVYDIVIFAHEDSNFVDEVCQKLDPHNLLIKYKLGKEATRLIKGQYVKDLNYLGRDLENVICIDYDPDHVRLNPRNTFILPAYTGDGTDRELLQSIVFLKEMASEKVSDVRTELDKYGNYRPYVNFYKSNPKFHKMLPPEEIIKDDLDLLHVKK